MGHRLAVLEPLLHLVLRGAAGDDLFGEEGPAVALELALDRHRDAHPVAEGVGDDALGIRHRHLLAALLEDEAPLAGLFAELDRPLAELSLDAELATPVLVGALHHFVEEWNRANYLGLFAVQRLTISAEVIEFLGVTE